MTKISLIVTTALLAYAASVSTAEGFTPSSLMGFNTKSTTTTTTSSSSSSSSLHVSVVSSILKNEVTKRVTEVFETESPESAGLSDPSEFNANGQLYKKKRNRRKHNFAATKKFRHEQPDTDFYTLHSSAVSHLEKDMPINDINRAIKRAQNLHDAHDLGTIAAFLMDECDRDWGYGFRGSLLSRTAVAALHMSQVDIATCVIDTRRTFERASMQPYESAAIVRGLMRASQVEQAWEVLEDELRLPLQGTDWSSAESQELLKHRAGVLCSIVSRHFYNGEPQLATRALESLGAMGELLEEYHMGSDDLQLPWSRLVNAAVDCQFNPEECSVDLPSDLSDLVFDAIAAFPCPGRKEECGLDDYLFGEE